MSPNCWEVTANVCILDQMHGPEVGFRLGAFNRLLWIRSCGFSPILIINGVMWIESATQSCQPRNCYHTSLMYSSSCMNPANVNCRRHECRNNARRKQDWSLRHLFLKINAGWRGHGSMAGWIVQEKEVSGRQSNTDLIHLILSTERLSGRWLGLVFNFQLPGETSGMAEQCMVKTVNSAFIPNGIYI